MEDQEPRLDESENNNTYDLDQSKKSDEKFVHPVNITTENSVSILDQDTVHQPQQEEKLENITTRQQSNSAAAQQARGNLPQQDQSQASGNLVPDAQTLSLDKPVAFAPSPATLRSVEDGNEHLKVSNESSL